MIFYKVRNTECDFCEKHKNVVTQVNMTYICSKCAVIINNHARINQRAVGREIKSVKIGELK